MRRFLCRYVAVLVPLILPLSSAEADTKVAVVTPLRSATVSDMLVLAEVELSDREGISLLERQSISDLLAEQELTLTGLVDAESAIQVGKLLAVDLLAVIEGDRASKKQDVLGLVVFDARLGIRLLDQTISGDPVEMVESIVGGVATAVDKHGGLGDKLRTVSVVGVRNVDLPRDRDGFCQGVGRLLERRVVGSPNVAVVERSFLNLVRQERALTDKAARNDLLGSLESLHVEISRGEGEGLSATVILTGAGGERRAVDASSADGSAVELVSNLLERLLEEIGAAAAQGDLDPLADAKRMINEAEFRYRHVQFHEAGALAEAAIALAPDEPLLWRNAAKYFLWQAFQILKPEWAAPDRSYSVQQFTPQQMEQALPYALRSLEVTVQVRQYEMRHGGLVFEYPFGSYATMAEDDVRGVFSSLLQSGVPLTRRSIRYAEASQMTYRHLAVDILLPQYYAKMLEDPTNHLYWTYYTDLVQVAPWYCWSADLWTKFVTDYAHQILTILDRHGPIVLRTFRDERISYVYLLNPITTWPETHQLLNARRSAHYDQLRELFQSMMKHERPGVRLFGMASLLWLDVRTEAASTEAAEQRCNEILDEAEKLIAEPGVEQADAERMACYEAALNAIDMVPPDSKAHVELLTRLKDFMLSREEVVLSVLRRTVRATIRNHGHYLRPQNFTAPHEIRWQKNWERTLTLDDFGELLATIERATELMGAGRVIDGNHYVTQQELGFARRRIYLENPGRAVNKGQTPWTGAARVLAVERLGMRYLSQPVVHGEHVYVVGLTDQRGDELELIRIRIADQVVTRLSRIAMPPPPEGRIWLIDTPHFRKIASPVLSPQVSGENLYCATPRYGGITVFPLDGSRPRRLLPENVPGMPTSFIADLALVGDQIFAVTSVKAGGEAYVHWYDPQGEGWKVIASSRRAKSQTPLDYPVIFHPGAVYDADRNRVLFFVSELHAPDELKNGLYQFDVKSQEISQVTDFSNAKPCFVQRLGEHRLLVTFAEMGLGVSHAIEFNMDTDRWRTVYSRSEETVIEGLEVAPDSFESDWNLWPPYAVVGDRLWSFLPFARVTDDDEKHERIQVVEWRVLFAGPTERGLSDHLEYLPDQGMLLYGTQYSLWLFALPDETRRGHWKFDEADGIQVADSASDERHGKRVNGPAWVKGKFGAALQFDGTDDSVTLGNPPGLNFRGPITMAAWIKPAAENGYRNIIAHGMTKNPKAKVFLWIRDGHYEGGCWDGTLHRASAKVSPEDKEKWVHLAVTYDGRHWRLFRNGTEIAAHADGTGAIKVNENWAIGSSGTGPVRCFKGIIDEVYISNRALSPGQIKTLAATGQSKSK